MSPRRPRPSPPQRLRLACDSLRAAYRGSQSIAAHELLEGADQRSDAGQPEPALDAERLDPRLRAQDRTAGVSRLRPMREQDLGRPRVRPLAERLGPAESRVIPPQGPDPPH